MITRREWIATMCAAPGAALLVRSSVASAAPASPVAIARCVSYDEDVTARLAPMFDQLGHILAEQRERRISNNDVRLFQKLHAFTAAEIARTVNRVFLERP